MDDIPWFLDITTHNFLAQFTQITDGFRRIYAFLAHIFEMYINTELLSKPSIFIYTIRVHHVSL
jgi:hypothetical protein